MNPTLRAFAAAALAVLPAQAYETADGTLYLLIPTSGVIAVEGAGRIQATSQTVALEDDGEWYLVRTDEPDQTELVKQLFPAFRDVTFPRGSMVPLD
jgi:hypothetical protein